MGGGGGVFNHWWNLFCEFNLCRFATDNVKYKKVLIHLNCLFSKRNLSEYSFDETNLSEYSFDETNLSKYSFDETKYGWLKTNPFYSLVVQFEQVGISDKVQNLSKLLILERKTPEVPIIFRLVKKNYNPLPPPKKKHKHTYSYIIKFIKCETISPVVK